MLAPADVEEVKSFEAESVVPSETTRGRENA